MQLDSAAFGEAKGLRRGEDIIDSLAYIDDITPDEQRIAENLIKEEIKEMAKRPADYLKELPKPHQVKFEGHPVLQAEWERVRADAPMAELDRKRFECLPPPDNRKNDVTAWHSVLDNAHSQMEHSYNKLLNTELMLAHGPKQWQAYIRSLEVGCKRLEEDARGAAQEIVEVNKRRKLRHQEVGEQLRAAEDEWMSLLRKNREIETACNLADNQAQELQRTLDRMEKDQEAAE